MQQAVRLHRAIVAGHADRLGGDVAHHAVAPSPNRSTRVNGGAGFVTRTHHRGVAAKTRHRLALHVRAHEGTVRVVVLKERDERGRHADDLHRRNVHVVHAESRHRRVLRTGKLLVAARASHRHEVGHDAAIAVQRGVRRGDTSGEVFTGRQVHHFVRHHAIHHAAVGGADEAEFVHATVGGQLADETDVRTFRRFNRADASVVRTVHVAHFQLGAGALQTAGAEARETTLVRQLAQRVRLVHERAQLVAAEERLDAGAHRLDRQDDAGQQVVLVGAGHAFAGDLFHADKAEAELALQQFAHASHALVAQVVNVVVLHVLGQVGAHRLQRAGEVVGRQVADGERNIDAQALVEVAAADLGQVVAALVKEQAVNQLAGGVFIGRFARSHALVNVQDRFARRAGAVGVQGGFQQFRQFQNLDGFQAERGDLLRRILVDARQSGHDDLLAIADLFDRAHAHQFVGFRLRQRLFFAEVPDHLRVAAQRAFHRGFPRLLLVGQAVQNHLAEDDALIQHHFPGIGVHQRLTQLLLLGLTHRHHLHIAALLKAVQRLHHLGDGKLFALRNLRVHHAVRVVFDLQPRSLHRDQTGTNDHLHRGVHVFLEVQARRAAELAHDDALAAVDDERSVVGHQGEVAQIDLGLDDGTIFPSKSNNCLNRSFKRHIPIAAFADRVLRLAERKADELQIICLRKVPDWGKSLE